jgi:hypothetical protein
MKKEELLSLKVLEGVLAHHALTDHYVRLGAVSSCL